MLGCEMIKTSLPDHQTSDMVAFYAGTCTVCMHLVMLKMLHWVFGVLI
jgi:hypothetical protein